MAETSVIFKLKGDTKDLDDKMDKSESKAGKLAGGLKTAFTVGIAAAAAGFAVITKSAVDSFAEYEQLVGGVETLFKDSTGIVTDYADNAYKTSGLSANKYIETVTGFSASLLQSLGGDTEKAAKTGDMAITDMADNANKMGSSIDSIQVAYQGFAKQNYTMLDNLKLGYGGTKEEMQRLLSDAEKLSGQKYDISSLNDVYNAIHEVQTEMGITGTTALEASTTIQGSTVMMKSSWSNLMTGLADDNQDFDKLMGNFVESVGTVIENLLPVVSTVVFKIFEMVAGLLPEIVSAIKELLPQVIAGIGDIFVGIVGVLPDLMDAIMEIIPLIVTTLLDMLPMLIMVGVNLILSILTGLSTMIPTIMEKIIEIIPQVIDALVGAIPQLIKGAIDFFMAIVDALPTIIKKLVGELPKIIKTTIKTLIANLPALIDGAIKLFMALVDAIPIIIDILIPMIPTIIDSIIMALLDALPVLIEGAIKMWMALIEAIPYIVGVLLERLPAIVGAILTGLAEPVKDLFGGMWDELVSIFGNTGTWFEEKFEEAWQFIQGVFDGFGEFFDGLWDNIKSGVSGAWDWIMGVLSGGGKIFDGIVGSIEGIFKTVVNGIIDGINKIISIPFGFISDGLKFIHNIDLPVIGQPFKAIPNGIDIPKIPRLATGGIVDKATVAMVGEAGEEAIVPMSDDRMLSRLADKISNAGSSIGGMTINNLTIQSSATNIDQLEAQLINLSKQRGF